MFTNLLGKMSFMTASLYKALGLFFVALAGAGVVLPLLPTTPFLLLAAGCFARSSQRWHDWLMSRPLFSQLLRDWHEHRCVSLKTKVVSVLSMVLFGGYAVVFTFDSLWLKALGISVLLTGFYYVGRIKICPPNN